jgi:hypothetical protein
VDRNVIEAGCTRGGTGVGLEVLDAPARVQNNVIRGATGCTSGAGPAAPTGAIGVRVMLGTSGAELDLHSNTIFAAGVSAGCTGHGILWGRGRSGPWGLVRNNIVDAGLCPTRYAFTEGAASADPRVLENNDLFGTNPTALYRDEATTDLLTIGAINALVDITSAANLSAPPLFVGVTTRIAAGSPCRNTGTSVGAPTEDLDGDARPQEGVFDVGADEYVP